MSAIRRRFDFLYPLAIAGIVSLAWLYLILWVQLIGVQRLRTTTDFVAFYAAGRIAQTEGAGQVYNLQSQRAVEEVVVGHTFQADEVNPFVHPPFVIPLLEHVIQPDYIAAYQSWALVMSAFFVVSAACLVISLPRLLKRDAIILLAVLILFFPGMVSILNGQDSAILLLGGAIWLYGLLKRKDRLAGLGLALTIIRPQISLALALPFLFKRRLVWWWYCVGFSFLAAVSLLVMGPEGIRSYFGILTVSASGEGYLIHEWAMVNLLGLLRNIFLNISAVALRDISWVFFLAAIVGLCLLWARSKLILERHIGLAVILSVFASPHLHYHDLVLLLLPLAGSMRLALQRDSLCAASLAPILSALSFLLLINHMVALPHVAPYLLMLALVLWLWYSDRLIKLFKRKHVGLLE